jgi:hypothetical protein
MKIDGKAIVNGVWLPLVVWAAAVLLVGVVNHQPGVVCMTPVAWLMALWVGLRCAAWSRSTDRSSRLKEAAIGGVLFGILQGLLFAVVVPFMGPISDAERQKTFILVAVIVVAGALVSGVLSLVIAASQERRRTSAV